MPRPLPSISHSVHHSSVSILFNGALGLLRHRKIIRGKGREEEKEEEGEEVEEEQVRGEEKEEEN
jgi:hypothetical protein